MSSTSPKAQPPAPAPRTTNIQVDIEILTSLLSISQDSTSDETTLSDQEVAELLRRLETADGLARGVESRLDSVIDELDGLLASLESPEEEETEGDVQAVQDEVAAAVGGEPDGTGVAQPVQGEERKQH